MGEVDETIDTTLHNATPATDEPGYAERAIAFGAGGFGTAMQLGTVHALLVAQAKAPETVIGLSAGSANAVTLAEVMQAGSGDGAPSPNNEALSVAQRRVAHLHRRKARVAKLREHLDAHQRSPKELVDTLLPDTIQVGSTRPLAPLELPIHDLEEREQRQQALNARSGLLQLINDLLSLHMTVGTMARGLRRWLGIQAAAEIRSPWRRVLAVMSEVARLWLLVGANLRALSPLLYRFVRPLLRETAPEVSGATAADVIFKSRTIGAVVRGLKGALSFVVLATLWLDLSVLLVLVVPGVIVSAVVWLATGWLDHGTWAGVWVPRIVQTLLYSVLLASLVWFASRHVRERRGLWIVGRDLLTLLLLIGLLLAVAVIVMMVVHVLPASWERLGNTATWKDATEPALRLTKLYLIVTSAILAAFALLIGWLGEWKHFRRNLLAQYNLADSLLPSHPLRQLLVSVFDPGYYGQRIMDDVVDRALRDDRSPSDQPTTAKTIGQYVRPGQDPPIRVGVVAGRVSDGALVTLGEDVRVVDGLVAAMAISPLLPPVAIGDELFVDGVNVANEPTRALMTMLRGKVKADTSVLHVYSVSSLPFSLPSLPLHEGMGRDGPSPFYNLIDVVYRALDLQRFRDATLERRLTHVYTRAIPAGRAMFPVQGLSKPQTYLRSWVIPIEPERPLDVNTRVMQAQDEPIRRAIIAETVAEGCRAALQVMIGESVRAVATPREGQPQQLVRCIDAVRHHISTRGKAGTPAGAVPDYDDIVLPGSDRDEPGKGANASPGLSEVCRHCAWRSGVPDTPGRAGQHPRTLRYDKRRDGDPVWPLEWEDRVPVTGDPRRTDSVQEGEAESGAPPTDGIGRPAATAPSTPWPRTYEGEMPGDQRPLVSLLFSGGVFRGVFQMGVLNALSEVGVRPDIIAGASVGSISAAMVARAFGESGKSRLEVVARLAGTFLALDRLILTDRFADFVRNFTLRAADASFSLRQADRFFRRFDAGSSERFAKDARVVVSGLERLLYITPFELRLLMKALRERNNAEVGSLLNEYTQKLLHRMGVGDEVLGSEPLALLITEHVLQGVVAAGQHPAQVPFDVFRDKAGILFLATTTNLTQGRLEVLGSQDPGRAEPRATLLNGLLSSSAFPGVFRPRWSWEVKPLTSQIDQYIDGGVMDNLPLDAVARFMVQASDDKQIARRPVVEGKPVPHLLFAASLETSVERLDSSALSKLAEDWPSLLSRIKTMRYNKKIEIFQNAQRALRAIHETVQAQVAASARLAKPLIVPLDLEVVSVVPEWLCGTFGFHPMLGFRRNRQAASIAHGCRSTLFQLGKLTRNPTTRAWLPAWGVDITRLPDEETLTADEQQHWPPKRRVEEEDGRCWWRNTACPFSAKSLKPTSLPEHMKAEVAKIHVACRKRENHYPAKR